MNFILRVKEFYLLELLQLKMYESQLHTLENDYVRHAYERMVELEQGHVDFFKNYLIENNSDIPSIPGSLMSLAGKFIGHSLDLTSADNRYKIGAAVESKAIEMYHAFILETWDDKNFNRRLWHNMIDEEFHLLWFKDNQKSFISSGKYT
ncbi:MAG: demethoxyubiquinone hydroxylase family protein [Bacillota bacterium]